MKKEFFKWLSEKGVFYALLLFSVLLLFTVKFYPSMDGPCHLYNSNLISHLLKGNITIINNYFILNKFPIPNWTSYLILSFFSSFLPAWLAEKILLLFYFVGLSLSFRFLIKQLCPDNIGLSVIIFPFTYSFLFHLGFYNYSLSFIFLFFALGYWLKFEEEESLRKYFVLFTTITLTYLSALLSFIFLGFCLGLFIIAYSIKSYSKGIDPRQIRKKLTKQLFLLLVISLPVLIFSAIFIKSTFFFPSNERHTIGELVKWLNDVRCIIVYDYDGEGKITEQFLHILIAIIAISLYIRFYKKDATNNISKFSKSDVFIIPILLTLICFFIVPNGANAGMMSDRFCLLAYMFFIVWGVSQPIPKRLVSFFVVLIVIFHLGLLMKRQNGALRGLDKDAKLIYDTSNYIEKNSIVLPVNMSENWIEPHFSNYLGVDKPMIILENYEASVGWFPVLWNTSKLPWIKLGQYESINGMKWTSNTTSTTTKQIDYVFLYGNTNKIKDPSWSELKIALDQYYTLVFSSENNYISLYKREKGISN